MKTSRRKVEEILWAAGLHGPARLIYRATTGRRSAASRKVVRAFYAGLLPSGSLVFDVGANVGAMSAIFSSLGNQVVALEPNPDCVRHIQLSYPDSGIEVIQAVAGARNGLATLKLSDERDDVSSLSDEWIAAIKSEHPEYRSLWSKQISVPMLTLDTAIEHYGMPFFIKIDVEGSEEQVLDGLSAQPSLISFEFNAAFLSAAMRCLQKPLFSASSRFNFAMGDPVRFELETWVGKQTLQEILSRMEPCDRHGDIFVKRTPISLSSQEGPAVVGC
jgi:FkbM family methyltransferase